MAIYDDNTPEHVRQGLLMIEAEITAAVLNVLAQEDVVERLKAAGYSTQLAERMLSSFKDVLTLRITARDRIRALLRTMDR